MKAFLAFGFKFLQISNTLTLSYCRGWAHPRGVRKPNSVLGVLSWTNFPGFVTLPGEGQGPTLGFSSEHYQAAQAPPEEIIDGVLCHTRAEMVIKSFWVNYPFTQSKINNIANYCTNFPGFVTLPGEGQGPTLGFSSEHYQAAQAPPEEIIDGVLCHTRAEMVIKSFWVNYPFTQSKINNIANYCTNRCFHV